MTFQSDASYQGRKFENAVETLLRIGGWRIIDLKAKVGPAGIEVDIVAESPIDGRTWWIECKGSWKGTQPGSRRGDTVKKAVAVAWYINTLPDDERCPYMLITSHMPNPGTISYALLEQALADGLFDAIHTVDLPLRFDEDDS